MKKRIVTLNGTKVCLTIEELGWITVRVTFYIPKRRGQLVNACFAHSDKITDIRVYNTPDCAIIDMMTTKNYFPLESTCIEYCINSIISINKHVNFEAKDSLVTKELLNIFK